MQNILKFSRAAAVFAMLLSLTIAPLAQKKAHGSKDTSGPAVMWQSGNISSRDLFYGPGGKSGQPNISKVTLIKEEKGGHSKKFRIKDADGKTWVAKTGDEAQSETAAVRLLWALGYKTEINYLVPTLTIPGAGTFSNVRLEARPDNVDRGKPWSWKNNPFQGKREYQGLKIMMAFLNNWDMKEANNVILKSDGEKQYVISDLGVSFGKTGSTPLPIFWRIGRSRNDPKGYAKSKFIKGTTSKRIKVNYNGKNRPQMNDLTLADARWLADLLVQLSDEQIRDAFRAANYSQKNIDLLTKTVKNRINELDRATAGDRMAIGK